MQAVDDSQETRPGPAVPGPVGLLLRVVVGAAAVYALVELLTKWDIFRDQNLIESDFWFITLFTLCLLADVFNIGLRRQWGPWPIVVFVAGAVALGSVGYLGSGEVWTTALAAWVYAGDLLVFGAASVAFPVAIVMRTPGCELNALPRLVARLRGTADAEARRCLLGVDLLDRQPTPSSRRRDMEERHVSVMIGAPPEIVFGLYTDPGRARDWLSGLRDVHTAGPPDQPGSRAVFVYRWPFKVTAEVLQAQPPNLHVQRLKELLGLVTCTTTARFRRVDGGTELRLEMRYRVVGGPIGRLVDPWSGTRWPPHRAGTWPGSRRWPRSGLGRGGPTWRGRRRVRQGREEGACLTRTWRRCAALTRRRWRGTWRRPFRSTPTMSWGMWAATTS